MKPSRLFPALLLTVVTISGCIPKFSYRIHAPARVSVIHSPLHPGTGDAITITARPEVEAGRSVAEVKITFGQPVSGGGSTTHTKTCAPADLTTDGWCVLTVAGAGAAGLGRYSATITDDVGTQASSATSYRFQIGAPASGNVFALREPTTWKKEKVGYRVLLCVCEDEWCEAAVE